MTTPEVETLVLLEALALLIVSSVPEVTVAVVVADPEPNINQSAPSVSPKSKIHWLPMDKLKSVIFVSTL